MFREKLQTAAWQLPLLVITASVIGLAVNDFHMGISNELCSERYHVTREDQDRYAEGHIQGALSLS
ncbi:MAG TPA: hypothetical protein ENF48_05675 [Desulfobacteraceae bacterium]|nr:hypothetical protein [Desulfobacteraceae bacterium]